VGDGVLESSVPVPPVVAAPALGDECIHAIGDIMCFVDFLNPFKTIGLNRPQSLAKPEFMVVFAAVPLLLGQSIGVVVFVEIL